MQNRTDSKAFTAATSQAKGITTARLSAMTRNALLGLTIGLCGATSWAVPAFIYGESYQLNGTQQYRGAGAPHATNTVYSLVEANNSFGYGQTVEFSSTPMPYVRASSWVYGTNAGSYAIGYLGYNFIVSGAANTRIPVKFQGRFAMSGANLTVENPLPGAHSAGRGGGGVYFTIGDSTDGVFFEDYCGSQCTHTERHSTYADISANYTRFGADGVEGLFNGYLSVLTDSFGYGTKTVRMIASAGSSWGGSILTTHGSAFIDPEFHIDSSWLALNPDARLFLQEGVGNGVVQESSVPEPDSMALMLTGLGLLAGFIRRRDRLS